MKLRIDLISMCDAGMIFQAALQGLFACQPHSLTCVQRVTESGPSPDVLQADGMVLDGTSPEALQFGSGPSRPWRANENSQVALVCVVPAVV
jgi:hypothetical protein